MVPPRVHLTQFLLFPVSPSLPCAGVPAAYLLLLSLHSVQVDDTPWLVALQRCVEPSYANYLTTFQCSSTYIALASERAKKQLLPTLRILARQKKPLPSTGTTTATTTDVSTYTTAPVTKPSRSSLHSGQQAPPTNMNDIHTVNKHASSPLSSSAVPSAKKIESLLALLDNGDDQSETKMTQITPSLSMTFPSPGGRVSGGVVAFIGKINLGAELAARLATKAKNPNKSPDTKGFAEEQGRLDPQGGGHTNSGSGGGGGGGDQTLLPDVDRCVVRVIVDGAVASIIDVDPAAAADDNNQSDPKATMVIKTALIPAYERNARCSEHPAKTAAVAAAAGEGAWADNEAIWRLETRAIDRICTREAFGAHHIYGELACHSSNSGGPGPGYVSS